MLALREGHIIFPFEMVKTLFEDQEHVDFVYYDDRKALLVASRTKTFFAKLHKTNWKILKIKNLKGDKSLFILDTLIDYDLSEENRDLKYQIKSNGIIEIFL